jgi:hypothetical protein
VKDRYKKSNSQQGPNKPSQAHYPGNARMPFFFIQLLVHLLFHINPGITQFYVLLLNLPNFKYALASLIPADFSCKQKLLNILNKGY